ncbi:MAG: hypothetical protein R2939_06800 [Kofleriaceae bacterium]
MAYDAARARVVMFGGSGGSIATAYLDETWLWDGATWIEAAPAVRPPGRIWSAMSYDAAAQRVVLFGGVDDAGPRGDTWLWDGASWLGYAGAAPPARYSPTLAYDAARAETILFGGSDGNVATPAYTETWAWTGIAWVERAPAVQPPPRDRHVLAPRGGDGVVVFGGVGADGFLRDDTWTWDGTSWALATAAPTPVARSEASFVDVTSRGRTILFGGRATGPMLRDDTWSWDGNGWEEGAPVTSPPARYQAAMAYDAARDAVVLFGGTDGVLRDDTWLLTAE